MAANEKYCVPEIGRPPFAFPSSFHGRGRRGHVWIRRTSPLGKGGRPPVPVKVRPLDLALSGAGSAVTSGPRPFVSPGTNPGNQLLSPVPAVRPLGTCLRWPRKVNCGVRSRLIWLVRAFALSGLGAWG